jgi:hypothetical protein
VGIYSGNDVLVNNSRLVLRGITRGDTKLLAQPAPMPANSIWKFKIEHDAGEALQLPQSISATYLLRYADGPSNSREWTASLPASGIGWWSVDGEFQVM